MDISNKIKKEIANKISPIKKGFFKVILSCGFGFGITFILALFITLVPVEDSVLGTNPNLVYESKMHFFSTQILKEFSIKLMIILAFLSYFILDSRMIKDYFPFSTQLKESGIHAKLNYQIIADRMSRKLTMLISFIILFSMFFIFTIFKFSSELDRIIHKEDIDAYEMWIASIEKHVGKSEGTNSDSGKLYEFVETNTQMFWMVYFIRYITVRIFIAILVATIITFLIRLYLRTRSDRSLIVQKEEALSALHYLARGEWRYQYDVNGNLLFKNIDSNKIIIETELNGLGQEDRGRYRPLALDILIDDEDKDAHINTKDFLDYIPIKELFRSIEYTKSKGGDSKSYLDEYSLNLETIKKQLAEVSNELKNMVIISNRSKNNSKMNEE